MLLNAGVEAGEISKHTSGSCTQIKPEDFCIAFQGEYFMVQDVYSKADVLNTTSSYGAPNFRQMMGSYPLFGMGQPSLNGFKQVLQRLQAQGHEVTVIFLYKQYYSWNLGPETLVLSCCIA